MERAGAGAIGRTTVLAAWRIGFGTTSMIPGVQLAASKDQKKLSFKLCSNSHNMLLGFKDKASLVGA